MKKNLLLTILLLTAATFAFAQDTVKQQLFNLHFQQTIITQYKPAFSAPYSVLNS